MKVTFNTRFFFILIFGVIVLTLSGLFWKLFIDKLFLFGASLSILWVFLLILYFTDNISKDEAKISLLFFILGFVISLGFHYISKSHEYGQQAQPNFNKYTFMIDFGPTNYIRVRQPTIDIKFSEQKGNITFFLDNDDLRKIEWVRVDLSTNLNIIDTIIYNRNRTLQDKQNYITSSDEENSINIELVNNSFEYDETWFTVLFNGNVAPKGDFDLTIYSERVITYFQNNIFLLELAPYECTYQYPCFVGKSNAYGVVEKNNLLTVSYSKDYYDNPPISENSYRIFEQEFSLNTVDGNKLRDADFNKALGTGMITSGIFGFLVNFVDCIMLLFNKDTTKNNRKNKKKPEI